MSDTASCPACHGLGEKTPAGQLCPRCDGSGEIDVCWATGSGQREVHDLRLCGHYPKPLPDLVHGSGAEAVFRRIDQANRP